MSGPLRLSVRWPAAQTMHLTVRDLLAHTHGQVARFLAEHDLRMASPVELRWHDRIVEATCDVNENDS